MNDEGDVWNNPSTSTMETNLMDVEKLYVLGANE